MRRTKVGQKFADAKAVLEGVQDAEAKAKRERERKADWDDADDMALYKNSVAAEARDRLLNKLVGRLRVCPVCKEVRPERRSWLVNRLATKAICRACFDSIKRAPARQEALLEKLRAIAGASPVVSPPMFELVSRFVVKGSVVSDVRRRLGLNQSQLARMMGWSNVYQKYIEEGRVKTVSREVATKMGIVFFELGVLFERSNGGDGGLIASILAERIEMRQSEVKE
jgi:hypothetical protein